MKCKNCGTENKDGVKFCSECGHEMIRERTLIDPLPELDEFRRVRNKIYLIDEHSKPLNIYCYVMIGICAIAFIAGLISKVVFLPIFTGFFIVVLLLMLWANNRETKRVRFAVGRPLIVILPVLLIFVIFAAIFSHRTDSSYYDDYLNGVYDDEKSDENYAEADEKSNDVDEEAVEAGIITYESTDGWKISYDTEKFFLNDTLGNGEICFNYIGECSGTTAIIISYFPGKMPDEVLYDKTADIDDSRITRGEAAFGKDMYWSHYRHIAPVNEDPEKGDVIYEGFTAIEHNGGSVLIDSIDHLETDDEQYSAILNSVSELLNTFELVDHEPQTEYAYIPGEYVHEYTEEIEGEVVNIKDTVILNEDHSCEVSFQDTISGEWTGTKLIMNNGEEIEYTVEGDELYLNQPFGWVAFKRN